MSNRKLEIELEKKIARAAVAGLLAAGWLITVNDGEEDVLECSTDPKAIDEAMYSTDEESLYVTQSAANIKDGQGYAGWVYFVWGNVTDVISDYTVNLGEAWMAEADKIADAYR